MQRNSTKIIHNLCTYSATAIEALDSARVGSFGNSDHSSPAEWVPVIMVDAPDSGAASDTSSGSGSRFVPSSSQSFTFICMQRGPAYTDFSS